MLTHSRHYARKVKRSIQQVATYLLLRDPRSRGLNADQRRACHYFCDMSTVDSERRTQRGAKAPESATSS